ncbi:MAG: monovalent cation/H+ antiporter subunit D family protein [Rhodospirillaceae bacterium]|nr:monovalent cation/H+ antiporter subunit D family protein [Rhodospirillaceae bacterium]MBL6931167.1 monovalent cation/H+ antiporter subunit D family protein [Rhodospirillales bacterium]MBL6940712.1 monovalent cation/H+ antiporter subunit D family protein [Rhodospirillales bacterium]
MSPETTIQAALLTPVIGAVLISLCGRWTNLRETVTLVTAVILFSLVISLYPLVLEGGRPSLVVGEMLPNLSIAFTVEPLGMLFACIASFLWIVNSLYSIGYMRGNNEKNQTRFYVCFAIALASSVAIAFAGNMMTLFIFYEALTISTYPLVTHAGTEKAKRGGRVYLGILLSTSIGLLFLAIVWTWMIAGTLDFTPGGILEGKASNTIIGILLALYMFGIGKAALMPFHRWLPAAMVAPTPVSALLHAVAVVKAGVFTVVKVIIYIFGVDFLSVTIDPDWLLYISGFTILAASIIALRSDNLKRRLAYSTISQLSYVIMAAAILAPLSVLGAALHIAVHAFGKITLFFAAGSIYTASHKTEVSQLDGIGRRMPWTMGAFAIGALSMIGVPPTAGFISKWYILHGAFDSGQMLAVGIIIVSSLLNASYFLPIVHAAFFKKEIESPNHDDHGEAPFTVVIALTVTATITILLFFFPGIFIDLARQLI